MQFVKHAIAIVTVSPLSPFAFDLFSGFVAGVGCPGFFVCGFSSFYRLDRDAVASPAAAAARIYPLAHGLARSTSHHTLSTVAGNDANDAVKAMEDRVSGPIFACGF